MMQLTARANQIDPSNFRFNGPRPGGALQETQAAQTGRFRETNSPTYLKGFCNPVNFFITPSITSEVHCGTFSCSYTACCAKEQKTHSDETSAVAQRAIEVRWRDGFSANGRHAPPAWPQLLP